PIGPPPPPRDVPCAQGARPNANENKPRLAPWTDASRSRCDRSGHHFPLRKVHAHPGHHRTPLSTSRPLTLDPAWTDGLRSVCARPRPPPPPLAVDALGSRPKSAEHQPPPPGLLSLVPLVPDRAATAAARRSRTRTAAERY